MKYASCTVIALAALAPWCIAAEPTKTMAWQGTLHFGDNPMQYSTVQSAGMALQIPCTLDADKKGKLTVTTRDIQTLAGDGHYAELVAHYQDDDGPAREYIVESFRLKGDSNNADVDHTFELNPMKNLYQKPAYYSIRIKIDTQIKFNLWDDFVMKRIEVEQ